MVVDLRRRRAWALIREADDDAAYLRSLIFEAGARDVTTDLDEAMIFTARDVATAALRDYGLRADFRVVPVFVAPEDDK